MDPMAEIRETFFIECEELLEALEEDLIAMSEGRGDDETVNAVFRAVHSIKGGAGAFALDDLVRFAHKFETTLDEVRAGRLVPDEDVMALFLRGGDMLADLVRAARDGDEADGAAVDAMLAELATLTGDGGGVPAEESDDEDDDFGFQPIALDFGLGDDDDESNENGSLPAFEVVFKPHPELYANGNETGLLIRALADVGELEVECDHSALPAFDDLDPIGAYFTWTIKVTTDVAVDDIEEVFEFVEGACDLKITPVEAEAVPTAVDQPAVEPEPPAEEPAPEPEKKGVAKEAAKPAVEKPAPPKTAPKKDAAASGPKATVRVDLDRVDRLINLVGELVINQAMLAQCVEEAGAASNTAVLSGLDEFKQLTRDIQESVMAIRAQPVKPLFQRMSRIVREASSATGKKVRLVLEGDTTEVDKTVVERLSDPLTHMIRNAVDHGLESTEKRVEVGKPEEGNVYLTAAHRSGRVIIEVRDDGGGINRERVLAKAIENGLVPEDVELQPGEIDNLLFMPGFSTASTVSDLSGRGVGMDVVKRAIQTLGGRISISSEEGVGTTFSISLPLTLAVLDGMVVKVEEETLVVPLSAILETLRPAASDIHDMGDDAKVVFLRGRYVPIVDIGRVLGYRSDQVDFDQSVMLLIEGDDGTLSALAVDGIQDQRQVVIKGLEENYGHVDGIAAATILGDGRIALIVDPDALVMGASSASGIQKSAA
ncbi:MAG: chemotaxis protein CheA [Parvularcula sp.]